jgi:hypothetical protein
MEWTDIIFNGKNRQIKKRDLCHYSLAWQIYDDFIGIVIPKWLWYELSSLSTSLPYFTKIISEIILLEFSLIANNNEKTVYK